MYVDAQGECKGIDDTCNKYNKTNGMCLSCYDGYALNSDNRSCSIKVVEDPKCEIKGKGNECDKCYQGYYYSKDKGLCTIVDPQCKTYDITNGNCLSCYPGYSLESGKCIVGTSLYNFNDRNSQRRLLLPDYFVSSNRSGSSMLKGHRSKKS